MNGGCLKATLIIAAFTTILLFQNINSAFGKKFFILFCFGFFFNFYFIEFGLNFIQVYYQNYELISTVKLNEYSGYYGNVKLLRFLMPIDVLIGIWKLQLIATDSCPATNFYL